MGPQLCSCGNLLLLADRVYDFRSFNGAATLQLRKRDLHHHQESSEDRASMGPQLCSCGNLNSRIQEMLTEDVLQWGRNFAVAETGLPAGYPNTRCRSFNGAATLQLRKRRPLNAAAATLGSFNGAATLQLRKPAGDQPLLDYAPAASMGPQLCSCGNLRRLRRSRQTPARFNGAATLQLRKRRGRRGI